MAIGTGNRLGVAGRQHGLADCGFQLPVRNRLEKNCKGFVQVDPVNRVLLSRSGEENYFRADALVDCLGRIGAVHFAAQADVHQNHRGSMQPGIGHGALRGVGNGADLQAHILDLHAKAHRDDVLIFHYEHGFVQFPHVATPCAKTTSLVVPFDPRTLMMALSWETKPSIRVVPRPDPFSFFGPSEMSYPIPLSETTRTIVPSWRRSS